MLVLQGTICFCIFIFLKAFPLSWNIQGLQPVDSVLMKALQINMNVRKQINLQRTKSKIQVRHEVAIYSSPMVTPWGKKWGKLGPKLAQRQRLGKRSKN